MFNKVFQQSDPKWFLQFKLDVNTDFTRKVLSRNATDEYDHLASREERIVIWQKGNAPHFWYKCEGLTALGHPIEGLGDTPEECLESFLFWATETDKD